MFSQAKGRDGKPLRWMNLESGLHHELPPDNLVHTFYLWRCADITSKVPGILGNAEDAEMYKVIAEKDTKCFYAKFFDPAEWLFTENTEVIYLR